MDYAKRINKARKLLVESDCDFMMIADPINIFYLTGLKVSVGKFFIGKEITYLVVDGRYYENCKTHPHATVLKAESFDWKDWSHANGVSRLGFESQFLSVDQYFHLSANLKNISVELIALKEPIEELRLIKDEEEILLLKEAARLDIKGYQFVLGILNQGLTEEEVAAELEIFWKREGGKKIGFDPIIACGPHSAYPHYKPGKNTIGRDTHVLIDIGVVVNEYHSDLTRVAFIGQVDSRIETIHAIVAEAKNKALASCRPGIPVGELDRIARESIASQGYGDFFTHSLGHGVGLEIHERPYIRSEGPDSGLLLKKGMVITIEPGIYLPGVGGIRLEDTIVITETGHDILTR